MEKVLNFRDIGGVRLEHGREIKNGVFFRCAMLDFASKTDIVKLNRLKIKKIFDFRDKREVKNEDTYSKLNAEHINVPICITTEKLGELQNLNTWRTKDLPEVVLEDMCESYSLLPFNNPSYQKIVEAVKCDEVPILMHCTAGKDRTGVATAIIMLLLGVSEENIVEDYMKSKKIEQHVIDYMTSTMKHKKKATKKLYPLFTVHESYIKSALKAIRDKYETYQNYFEKEYGLTEEDIREIRMKYTTIGLRN